jgi:cell division protein FtsL
LSILNRVIHTNAAYQAVGGVKGALAKHAEQTFSALPNEDHRRLARALFLRLIEPGATEEDTTRRRAALTELILPDQAQTEMLRVCADAFVGARLLTTNKIADNLTIEVSHEALIREWERLGSWLKEARDDVRLQKDIAQDTASWVERGCKTDDDGLYRGLLLHNAQDWAARNVPSADESAFLAASAARQSELVALEEQRKHELLQAAERAEKAQQSAEQSADRASKARRALLLGVIAAVAVIVIAVAFSISSVQQTTLQAGQTLSPIPQTISAAQAIANDANQKAHAADTQVATAQTQIAVISATLTPVPQTLTVIAQDVAALQKKSYSFQLSADANALLAQNHLERDANGIVNMIYPSDPRLAALLTIHALRTAHTVQADQVLSKAIDQPPQVHVFQGHTNSVNSVAYSQDGRYILTGSSDKTARLWDTSTGQTLRIFAGHTGIVYSVAFSLTAATLSQAVLMEQHTYGIQAPENLYKPFEGTVTMCGASSFHLMGAPF